LQAIGPHGTSATEIGRRLGVSKQAAGKTVDRLAALARRKLIRLTPLGLDMLIQSAEIFDRLRARWVAVLGGERVADLETSLRTVVPAAGFPIDVPGWFG
jgi:DNA-binding MarR family transcriptional regulator